MTRRLVATIAMLLLPLRAWGQSTTFLYLTQGEFPTLSQTTAFSGTANKMVCGDYIESAGITNATQMAFGVVTAAGTACSVTIYDTGGTSIKATTGAVDCSSNSPEVKTATALDNTLSPTTFSLVAGTQYRVCHCRDGGTAGALRTAHAATVAATSMMSALGVTHMGEAANSCTVGSPPMTTGALSGTARAPAMVLLGTASP